MPIDRGSRTKSRDRVAFQKLGKGLGFTFGDGLTYDPSSGTVGVRITPTTAGILTFSGGALTTQYITTSGAVGNVTVTIAPDNDISLLANGAFLTLIGGVWTAGSAAALTLTTDTTFSLSSNVGASFFTITGADLSGNNAGATGGFAFDDGGDHLVFGPSGIVQLSGGAIFLTSSSDCNITLRAGDDSGAGFPGEVDLIGGNAAGVNGNGGDVTLLSGVPNGTGKSSVYLICNKVGGGPIVYFQCNQTGIAVFGGTPAAQSTGYTVGTVPAVGKNLNLATATAAYTGVPLALLNAATITDLNALRVDVVNMASVLRQLIKNLGGTSGYNWVGETGY